MKQPTRDYDIFSPPHLDDPHTLLAEARDNAPVFFSPPLGTWVVTRYDDVVAVLRDPERFSSAHAVSNVPLPPPEPILAVLAKGVPYEPNSVDLDPPRHTEFRGFINQAFTPRRISGMAPLIEARACALVDGFAARGSADLVTEFAYPLPTLIIGEILGVPSEDIGDFKRWSDEWMVLWAQRDSMERVLAAAEAVVEFQRYIGALVEDRRAEPRDDLTSDIVRAADALESPPSDAALVSLLMTVLFAGHETVTGLITSTIALLDDHPEVRDRVLSDRSLVPAAITEAIRLRPPVSSMYRTARADVELGGVTIAAGDHVQLSFISANRDAAHFEHADRFDIDRPDKSRLLSFGRGIHYCVGASLAQLEGRIAVEALFDRLPGLHVVPDQAPTTLQSATIRGAEHLQIAWTKDEVSAGQ